MKVEQHLSRPPLNRNLSIIKLMAGNMISFFGDRVYLIALPWLVFNLTGSALAMGTVAAFERLPNLLQPLTGTIADRLDRKKMMLSCDLARSFLLSGLGVLYLNNRLEMPELYAGALLLGMFSQAYNTCQFSVVPSLVRRKDRHLLNSLDSGIFHAAEFAGPALGGIIIGLYGPGWALIVNGISFLATFWAVLVIRFPMQRQKEAGRSFFRDVKEGFRFVIRTPALLYTNLALLISIFGTTMFLTLMIFYFRDGASLSAEQIGVILSVGGMAAVGGALFSNVTRKYIADQYLLFYGFLAGGGSVVLFGLSTSFVWLLVSNAIGVFAVSLLNPCILTMRQNLAPEHLLGRVQAVSRFMTWSLMPVASLLAGVLSGIWSMGAVIAIGGALKVCAAFIFFHPSLKKRI